MQHDEIDMLLSQRKIPAMSAGLSERIIHAALQSKQGRAQGVNLWNEILAMLAVPHPSVAVAAGILLGMVMGIQASDGLSILDQDWSSFLFINEGGWL